MCLFCVNWTTTSLSHRVPHNNQRNHSNAWIAAVFGCSGMHSIMFNKYFGVVIRCCSVVDTITSHRFAEVSMCDRYIRSMRLCMRKCRPEFVETHAHTRNQINIPAGQKAHFCIENCRKAPMPHTHTQPKTANVIQIGRVRALLLLLLSLSVSCRQIFRLCCLFCSGLTLFSQREVFENL